MSSVIPDRALRELGRTEGGADTLGLLVRDQDTRRLVLLRAVLDAAAQARQLGRQLDPRPFSAGYRGGAF
ncbi:hypothetical protein ABT146_05595, partial [Streptomyces sp. NPDC001743]